MKPLLCITYYCIKSYQSHLLGFGCYLLKITDCNPLLSSQIFIHIGSGHPKGGNGGNGNQAPRNNKASADYKAQIAQGKIPGNAGKDYPANSLHALRKRPGFENIEMAPDHLITPDYPGLGGSKSQAQSKRPGGGVAPPRGQNQGGGGASGGNGGYCPGGSLQECIRFCPSDESGAEFSSCVSDCGTSCPA